MQVPASELPEGPVVRALLMSDLVDSTAMQQRLGDHEAARVLAAEDEAGRLLAHRYQGLEIDKSDGFLFLFDEVWQAVGFAIDYHRTLAELSHTLPMPLMSCAKKGLLNASVMSWGTMTPIAFVRRVFRLRAMGFGV